VNWREQPVERAALPQLYAATAAGVQGGQFFGPGGLGETRGRVTEARLSRDAADPAIGRQLWAAAQELTGISYRRIHPMSSRPAIIESGGCSQLRAVECRPLRADVTTGEIVGCARRAAVSAG
jgi:hypothetical protein